MSRRIVVRANAQEDDSSSSGTDASPEEDTGLLEGAGSQRVVQFKRKHAQFWKDFRLSFFVGVWMMVFGAFSYSGHLRALMFGDPKCEEKDLQLVWIDGIKTWCGWMPNSYAANWSNLVMMIVFTVYRNTGTTIMFAWQGIAGTAVAVANLWLMQLIFGIQANNIIVWLDIILFYFVVLCSGAAQNTMMFALNWHSYFMMDYINPVKGEPSVFPMFIPYMDWDSNHVESLATSIAGALLAIIATVIPVPITLTAQVQDDAETIVNAADKIWTAAIDYICGPEPSTRQDQISEAVRNMNSIVSQVQGNLSDSWWESFDLCGMGRRRQMYAHLDDAAKRLQDLKVVMANSLCMASFSDQSQQLFTQLRPELHDLRRLCISVFHAAVVGASDGDIDDEEHAKLEQTCSELQAAQAKLYGKYLSLAKGDIAMSPSCSKDLMQEVTFLFAISLWADKVCALARALRNLDKDLDDHHAQLYQVGRLGVAGFRHTFGIPDKHKLMFAVRNVMSIGGSFIVSYAWGGRGMVFPEYSATMPATLSLLFHSSSGGSMVRNLKRLLGVLLGKVLPLVLLSIIQVAGSYAGIDKCGTYAREIVVGLNVFFLTWFADYVYFTSPGYSGVGCLMAAYGIGVLSSPCGTNKEDELIGKYIEVAGIVGAILISTVVDMVFEVSTRSYPRDVAVGDIGEMNEALPKSYESYFEGDAKEMREQLKAYNVSLNNADSMTAEADPSNEFFASYRTPFKLDVYRDSLETYRALKAEAMMLYLATEGGDPMYDREDDAMDSLLPFINGINSMDSLKREFQQVMTTVLQSLRNFLAHGAEDNEFQSSEEINNLIKVSGRDSLEGVSRAIADLNRHPLPAPTRQVTALYEDPRVRVTVAMASFHRSKVHLGDMDKMLLKRIML